MRIFHRDLSEGRHCHVALEASHKELETDTHSLLVQACGWGESSPTGKGVRDGNGHCQGSRGPWQIRTQFFIHLHLHAFGLGVHLILTGDIDVTVRMLLRGLVIPSCLTFLQLQVAKGGDCHLDSVLALLLIGLRSPGQ